MANTKLIGDTVRPELLNPDYSGLIKAGEYMGNAYSSIGETVGDYFKEQGEKKKTVKSAATQLQAALTLMPELSPVFSPIADNIKDENIPLNDRFAEASGVPGLISNSINMWQSQQIMNLRQQKFAASQGGGGGGGGGDSSNINPFTGQPY